MKVYKKLKLKKAEIHQNTLSFSHNFSVNEPYKDLILHSCKFSYLNPTLSWSDIVYALGMALGRPSKFFFTIDCTT